MKLIIEHPEWQTPKQRILLGFVTLLFWIVWFYIWIPFVSVLAWILGVKLFEYQMIELKGYKGVVDFLWWYALIIFVMGGSLIGWATYNYMRFNKVARRNARPKVTLEMEARYFKVDINDVEKWRKSQMVIIEHNDHAQITNVRVWPTQQHMESDVLLKAQK
jgi:biofilm PGA synthesis protein PgaD